MSAERIVAFPHREPGGNTLVLEVLDRDEQPFVLTGRYDHLEISVDSLEWLLRVGGPAALDQRRRASAA